MPSRKCLMFEQPTNQSTWLPCPCSYSLPLHGREYFWVTRLAASMIVLAMHWSECVELNKYCDRSAVKTTSRHHAIGIDASRKIINSLDASLRCAVQVHDLAFSISMVVLMRLPLSKGFILMSSTNENQCCVDHQHQDDEPIRCCNPKHRSRMTTSMAAGKSVPIISTSIIDPEPSNEDQ